MQFLSDVWLRCPDCDGKRYRPEVLELQWNGLSVADVLALTVHEALDVFREHPRCSPRSRRWPTSASTTCASASRCRRCRAARRSA